MDQLGNKNHWSASWRSGDAADCKSVYTGSIPVLASSGFPEIVKLFRLPASGRTD